MTRTMIDRFIPADFLTSNYYIFGQLKVAHSGLMGMFSDTTTSYLEVDDASIARIVKSDKVINYASTMWIVKSQIVAVCLNRKDYIGVQALARGGYTRLISYPMQITTPVYEITGTLQWAGRLEFTALMTEGTNDFFTIYNAVLKAALFPSLHIESPIMLLNRQYIDTCVPLKRNPVEE